MTTVAPVFKKKTQDSGRSLPEAIFIVGIGFVTPPGKCRGVY